MTSPLEPQAVAELAIQNRQDIKVLTAHMHDLTATVRQAVDDMASHLADAHTRLALQITALTDGLTTLSSNVAALQETVATLTTAQAETNTRLDDLTAQQAQTSTRLGELSEAQTRTEAKLTDLSDRVSDLSVTVSNLSDRVSNLSGTVANFSGSHYERHAARLSTRRIRRLLKFTEAEVVHRSWQSGGAIDLAVDSDNITDDEADDLSLVDLVVSVQNDAGQPAYVVAEISVTVQERNVIRALTRAGILNRSTGQATIPAVIGTGIDDDARLSAQQQEVTFIAIASPPDDD